MKAGLAAGAALAVLVLAAPAGAVKAQTIPLLEVQRSFVPTGGWAGNSFPAVGQGFVIVSDLYHWKGTARGAWAGTVQATCTFTEVETTRPTVRAVCTGVASLTGGRLSLAGMSTESDISRIAIVGGTGSFTGARGYVRIRSLGENSADTFVITG